MIWLRAKAGPADPTTARPSRFPNARALLPQTHTLKAAGLLWSHGPSAKLFVAVTAPAAIAPAAIAPPTNTSLRTDHLLWMGLAARLLRRVWGRDQHGLDLARQRLSAVVRDGLTESLQRGLVRGEAHRGDCLGRSR